VIKLRRMRWGEERRGIYRVLVWKPEGKRPLRRPRHRWGNTIKMDVQEVECRAWTGSSWLRIGRVAVTGECGNEPSGSMICGEFLD
jgi:hypothetical protein